MIRLTFLLLAMGLAAACESDGPRRLIQPTPIPEPSPGTPLPPPAGSVTPIALGQEVKATFVGLNLAFELTTPSNGTLVARLSWTPDVSLLRLWLGTAEFRPVDPAWSPVVGRIPVAAGQTYRLIVSGGGTDWEYNDPFILTTVLE